MPRDRSAVHRDCDEREFKHDDKPPPSKPYGRSIPRRGDHYSSDRGFSRDIGRYGSDAPPYGGRGDDYLRGGPGWPPPHESHSRYSREDRYGGGKDDRGYARDYPPRSYPRPEANYLYSRDGCWGGRDYYGYLGHDEPPVRYGRDEQLPPRGQMEAVPLPLPFRPGANLREPNDCEIIVVHRQNRNYAEMVERRLENLGMKMDLLFLKDEALLSRALEDLTQRGTLFAVVVTDQHEVHGTVTVNILYGVPQEHRNMPLDDSLKLVARHFWEQVKTQQAAAGGPDQLDPDRELQFLLKLLVDPKYLSIPELDRIIKYLTQRRDKQLMLERGESAQQQPRTVSSTTPSSNAEPEQQKPPVEEEKPTQQELQQRILSMIGLPGPLTATTVGKPPPTPVQPQQQAPAAASANDVPASTYINFDNPSVQQALENLIHNSGNLLKNLSSANSSEASPALSSQLPAKPPSGYGYGDGKAYGGSAPGVNNFGGHAGYQQPPPPLLISPGGRTTHGAMRHPLFGTDAQRSMMTAGRPGGGMPRY